MQLIQTEAGVGRYSVEILAEEEATGRKIVIENQLEATDYSHLGQILSYAAGIAAEFIIWVVREASDEHRQAIEWLNEHTDCFLVQIELWRIGDSDPAAKSHVISRANDWTKAVRSNPSDGELLDTKTWELEFSKGLEEFAGGATPPNSLRSPRPQHSCIYAIGRADCFESFTVHRSEDAVGTEVYIPNSKALFHRCHNKKAAIEQAVGLGPLSWKELPAKKASRIRTMHTTDLSRDNQKNTYAWLLAAAHRLKTAFGRDWPTKKSE